MLETAAGLGLLTGLAWTAGPVDYIAPNYIAPILSTGLVGIFLLMIVFRFKIMPTYVHEDAKVEWERERAALQADVADLKQIVKDANNVYTSQVIPTLTRVLDAERELVDIRRAERTSQQRSGVSGS